MYDDCSYNAYNDDGVIMSVKGAYSLCDDGCHKWPTMMEPSKKSVDQNDYKWTEMLESLRKDVEQLFRELKQEFAILKYGCRCNDMALMDNIFLMCCAIHNQRKVLARMDEVWNLEETCGYDFDIDLSQEEASVFRRLTEYTRQNQIPLDHNNGMGGDDHLILPYDDNVVEEHDVSHDVVKGRLLTHFKWADKYNEVF